MDILELHYFRIYQRVVQVDMEDYCALEDEEYIISVISLRVENIVLIYSHWPQQRKYLQEEIRIFVLKEPDAFHDVPMSVAHHLAFK